MAFCPPKMVSKSKPGNRNPAITCATTRRSVRCWGSASRSIRSAQGGGERGHAEFGGSRQGKRCHAEFGGSRQVHGKVIQVLRHNVVSSKDGPLFAVH